MLALFALSAILVPVVVRIERQVLSPVMDLALFRIRAFAASVGAALLNFYGIASVLILVPFFLVEARGLSTLQAGYALAAFSVAMATTAVLSGWLTGRVAPRTADAPGNQLLHRGHGVAGNDERGDQHRRRDLALGHHRHGARPV